MLYTSTPNPNYDPLNLQSNRFITSTHIGAETQKFIGALVARYPEDAYVVASGPLPNLNRCLPRCWEHFMQLHVPPKVTGAAVDLVYPWFGCEACDGHQCNYPTPIKVEDYDTHVKSSNHRYAVCLLALDHEDWDIHSNQPAEHNPAAFTSQMEIVDRRAICLFSRLRAIIKPSSYNAEDEGGLDLFMACVDAVEDNEDHFEKRARRRHEYVENLVDDVRQSINKLLRVVPLFNEAEQDRHAVRQNMLYTAAAHFALATSASKPFPPPLRLPGGRYRGEAILHDLKPTSPPGSPISPASGNDDDLPSSV